MWSYRFQKKTQKDGFKKKKRGMWPYYLKM